MNVGVGLPLLGPHARPESIELVATAADRLGFHSVNVAERLLLPAHDGWSNDFGLPDHPSFDALETLTWVAAKTRRVRLRTGVVVPLFQQPIVLARRLATLDHLSGGRVDAGLALGWLPQEYEATGVDPATRAAAFEESIAALRACWGPDPVAFEGRQCRIPPARVGPKPLHGTIAIHVGGVTRPAIERAARIGDGVTIAFRSWEATAEQIDWYRAAGGDGEIVVKGGPMLADAEHATAPSTWSEEQIADDLARLAEHGVDEFAWDLNIVGYEPARQVAALERLAAELALPARA
ncbi:TIGR03619 family F420-dependent LLM class oxidoreductase [Conexibacter stalactiti]|uniref:TIGR03619 family F420-dependent LLM class oxidoreductase n=1 Tax=Conexibacter stalactiti TaxID=1940611 RepID=A0ABU4HKL3_9ACTN|nr:TIGR03619 family F420-dependent LLM class oxidoreductase [Conexibacter stalactiti]MDW5593852.1 TIGR03619 family F420-dependent LLM class oxidoreductase [Conexibacter stalactiti]MEC5034494.1 TIGR03619 family F420-dependent LLM class oxidoreductase [Conexibacter stalactiti]